ncbi:hypothetical protein MKX03_031988 [Papaver bracteatum]|nr:hypothetical protein MKX03_031988 [Papaver bracteatum]
MELTQPQNLEIPTFSNDKHFFACEICAETVPMNRKFKNMEMKGCLHPYCTDCVAKYIEAKVIQYNISEIKCPSTDCNIILDASLCQSVLPKTVFEQWCRVLCESAVFVDSSKGGLAYGRSYCPYGDCSELVLNECVRISSSSNDTTLSRSTCPNCKRLFCFHCMIPCTEHHQCRRGDVIIDIDSKDVSFMKMVKHKKLTRCPTCLRYVERSGGCKNITCRCKTSFCYHCGRKNCACRPALPSCRRMMTLYMISLCINLFIFILFRNISFIRSAMEG